MAEFKLTISDPKSGKTVQKEVKEQAAKPFIGMKIGDTVKGDAFDLAGYEFQITGGSDYCGFPMRKGIQGARKKVLAAGGTGFGSINRKSKEKGIILKKTVCGDSVHDKISQINLKVTKQGKTPLFEEPKAEQVPADDKTQPEKAE